MEIAKLDQHLENALCVLRDSTKPNKGVVSAGLVNDRVATYHESVYDGSRWVHAERAAIYTEIKVERRNVREGAAMVTTLSPCAMELDDRRFGATCTDLLLGRTGLIIPITNLHIGAFDTWQTVNGEPADIEFYERYFNVTTPERQELTVACEALFQYLVDGIEMVDRPPLQEFLDTTLHDFKFVEV